MPAGQNAAGFGDLVKTALEYPSKNIEIPGIRKTDNVQSRLNVGPHRIDIA